MGRSYFAMARWYTALLALEGKVAATVPPWLPLLVHGAGFCWLHRLFFKLGLRYTGEIIRGGVRVATIQQGTPAFRRINIALFAGGFVTFAAMYCTQPLLPIYTREFALTPATASLSVSVTTGTLAVFLLVAGSLSEAWGRKPLMVASLLATAALTILAALSPSFGVLLVLRGLQGAALAGLPAIAMAYLSEEIAPRSLGLAMGMYISGNSVGGMGGRISVGIIADTTSWRIALATLGIVSIGVSVWFWRNLPPSRSFHPRPLAVGKLTRSLLRHLTDPGLLCLYGIGFLLMGGFVALYNYVAFLLIGAPYRIPAAIADWIFVVYLVGTFSSTWMGRLADRLGRRKVLWAGITIMLGGALLTLSVVLPLKVLGVAVFTFGFFGGHSIASSWVGRRATHDVAQASSLYLFAYYVGSSIGGFVGGLFWARFGWDGVIGMIGVALVVALLLALRLISIPPLKPLAEEDKGTSETSATAVQA